MSYENYYYQECLYCNWQYCYFEIKPGHEYLLITAATATGPVITHHVYEMQLLK